MSRISASEAGGVNVVAFLDTIAQSEIGAKLLANSDDGYDVIVGSTAAKPILTPTYRDHPRLLMVLASGIKSTAAGRYQFIAPTWDGLVRKLDLPDFSPESQDRACIQLLRDCGAFACLQAGMIPDAIRHAAPVWASLPGAGYGQHENKMMQVLTWFDAAMLVQPAMQGSEFAP